MMRACAVQGLSWKRGVFYTFRPALPMLYRQGLLTFHHAAIFWLKNAPAALKMLARCPTLLRFSPCKRAFALKILRMDEL